jgi:hypothetical protein
LLEGEVCRLGRHLVRASGRVLGECTVADPEHLIARLKLSDILPDGLDTARHVGAPDAGLGRAEPGACDAEEVRQARHEVPVSDVCARRENAHEHFVAAELGLIYVLEF